MRAHQIKELPMHRFAARCAEPDPIPAGTEASIIASPPTTPAVEAVVVVPEAVVPAAVVEQAIAAVKSKAPAVKKPRAPKAK